MESGSELEPGDSWGLLSGWVCWGQQEDGRQRAGLTRPELDVRQLEPAAFSKLIENNQQLGMVEAFLLVGPQTHCNNVTTGEFHCNGDGGRDAHLETCHNNNHYHQCYYDYHFTDV
jgi:hypothetical protein